MLIALRKSLLLFTSLVMFASISVAETPRVLPKGELPNDTRLQPLRGERGDFLLVPPKSKQQWQSRAARIRRVMQVSLGLWPPPTKTPLNAVIHGEVDCGEYTVSKVYFESVPGFFVTGSLYRPKRRDGEANAKLPAVLSPHGHFPGGRFQDSGQLAVRRQIVKGEERFEEGGRSFMQSRCVQLARMGCIVFHYDKIGYADSVQLSQDLVHRFSRARIKHKQPPDKGFYSASAQSRLQNMMGLHTYNSIRALDFLTSLPDVDAARIAVTGASGGGTQTFMLCAIDDRPALSIPVVIVSADRQGGCTCENICGLRLDTHNLDFTALHAPKPMLLISADDATRTMPKRGFPQLLQLYATLGKRENLEHAALLHFPHNYNYVSRARMYSFVNRHFKLGLPEPVVEQNYQRLSKQELSVWNDKHPQPKGGREFELKLLDWFSRDADAQIAKLTPKDAASLKRYRQFIGESFGILIRPEMDAAKFAFDPKSKSKHDQYDEVRGLLQYESAEKHKCELPLVNCVPRNAKGRVVLWIHSDGKNGLFNKDGELREAPAKLLSAGHTVVGVDLLFQGEFTKPGETHTRNRHLPNEEGFAGWTYCYNLPLFARRVHDVLAVARYFKQHGHEVDVVGTSGAGHWVSAAIGLSRESFDRAAIDTSGFRFANLKDVYDADFLPGAVKYGDLPGLLALAAPLPLWISGEAKTPAVVEVAYDASGKAKHLTLHVGNRASATSAAVKWLMK